MPTYLWLANAHSGSPAKNADGELPNGLSVMDITLRLLWTAARQRLGRVPSPVWAATRAQPEYGLRTPSLARMFSHVRSFTV
jgi:hypothetical protein